MCFTEREKKKKRFGFQKAFFQKVHLGKRGVVLYSGQYGNPNLVLCAAHFTEDSFHNMREYSAGFTKKLLLKDGAVHTYKLLTVQYWTMM